MPRTLPLALLAVPSLAGATPLAVEVRLNEYVAYDALVGGLPQEIRVTGATPGRPVSVSASPNPGGAPSCPAPIAPTCLTIGGPVFALGSAIADASGTATIAYTAPDPVPAGALAVQAWQRRFPSGGRLSPGVLVTLHDAASDADGDGWDAASEAAAWTDPDAADTDGDGVDDPLDPCAAGDEVCDVDADGWLVVTGDCDDLDALVSPGARDLVGDGVDQDCDGADALMVVHRADRLAAATWTGTTPTDELQRVAAAGDLDGDGLGDLVLAAPSSDVAFPSAGIAVLVYGSPAPTGDTDVQALPGFTGGKHQDQLGGEDQLDGAGDLDGDGYDDLILGNHAADNPSPFYSESGLVGIVYGGPIREVGTPTLSLADATFAGVGSQARLGQSAAGVGDLDGDGLDDASFVGVEPVNADYQTVYLVYGRAARLAGARTYTTLPRIVGQASVDDYLGEEGGVVGEDLDGDGLADLVIGSTALTAGDSRLYVRYGDPVRPGALSTSTLPVVTDPTTSYSLGDRMERAGDANGDGYRDLVVPDIGYSAISPGAGRVFLVAGGASPWAAATDLPDLTFATIDGVQGYSSVGWDCAAGDLTGDGVDDLAVSDRSSDVPYPDTGAVGVFHGPIAGALRFDGAETWIEGEGGTNFFGESVAVTDVDGDGWDDLVATSSDTAGQRGRAYLFLGGGL